MGGWGVRGGEQVAAKEEVWQVSAQLAGYDASVLLLQQLHDAGWWVCRHWECMHVCRQRGCVCGGRGPERGLPNMASLSL